MEREIKFVCNAVRWFDRVNGNTYHSVKITRVSDSAVCVSCDICYGYGDHYRQTALEVMNDAGWLPKEYNEKYENGAKKLYMFERENNYPILWNVTKGLKREMKNNVL